jgi:amino acid transporter
VTAGKRGLTRSLGLWGVLFLTLSITTPASSLFVIAPGILHEAGTGAVWALALAAIVSLATAFVYAELASAWPVAGGEYVFVGQTLGQAPAFVMLAVNLVSNILIAPVLALGVAEVAATLVPGLPAVPVAIGVLVMATLTAVLNIRLNARILGIFLAVELVALAVVAVLGLVEPVQPLSAFTAPVVAEGSALVPWSLAGFGTAAAIAIFALNGPGCAIYFGEEMHDAPQRLSRAILLSSLLTILSIGLPMTAALLSAPDLQAFLAADDPFGLFIGERGGPVLAAFVGGGIVLAIVNAVIATILACARFLYGTARDRSWNVPLDHWLSAIHPRWGLALARDIAGRRGHDCLLLPAALLPAGGQRRRIDRHLRRHCGSRAGRPPPRPDRPEQLPDALLPASPAGDARCPGPDPLGHLARHRRRSAGPDRHRRADRLRLALLAVGFG